MSVKAVAVTVPVGGSAAALSVGEVLELVVEVFEGRVVPHLGLDAHNTAGGASGRTGRRVCGWCEFNRVRGRIHGECEFTEEERMRGE